MILPNLNETQLILASKSPRRVQLLEGLGVSFEIRTREVDEEFPLNLSGAEIPVYLAQKKAEAFRNEITDRDLVITADTVVWVNDHVLNKPADHNEAFTMLKELSGRTHKVFTGVCLTSASRSEVFYDETRVTFGELTDEVISHYIHVCRPYDKAGAYGAQEMIGYIAISRIEGSYFNVMGLPVHLLYQRLRRW